MVFSNMNKNFTNTVKSRPPLVVFTVCLMGIIITTFSLAYYIHNYENPILNFDAKDDWLSLLKHFNTYDICIENTNGHSSQNADTGKQDNVVSTTTMAKISKMQFDQEINVEGLVALEDWSSKCKNKIEPPTHLKVAFTLPKKMSNATKENENICVTLIGPADFMPKLEKHTNACSMPLQKSKKYGKLTTKLSNSEQKDFCSAGSIGKLEFDIDFSKSLKWELLLSPEDRVMISFHLIVVSSLLLVVCVLITCYAMLVRSTTNSNGGDTKQSLMSKGMYL